MTENDIFNSPNEEAKRLAGELQGVKEVLRELLGKVTRIETRAKRAFPGAFPRSQPKPRRGSGQPAAEQVTLTPEQAMVIFDELVALVREGKADVAETRLAEIGLADLDLMRRELGVSMRAKKPSRNALVSAISGRIRESVMLTQHTTREQTPAERDLQTPSGDERQA